MKTNTMSAWYARETKKEEEKRRVFPAFFFFHSMSAKPTPPVISLRYTHDNLQEKKKPQKATKTNKNVDSEGGRTLRLIHRLTGQHTQPLKQLPARAPHVLSSFLSLSPSSQGSRWCVVYTG